MLLTHSGSFQGLLSKAETFLSCSIGGIAVTPPSTETCLPVRPRLCVPRKPHKPAKAPQWRRVGEAFCPRPKHWHGGSVG